MGPEFDETVWPFLVVLFISGLLLGMMLLIVLRYAYKWKRPVIWPAGRRTFCWLPKYQLMADLPVLSSETMEEHVTDRLAESGFRPVRRDAASLMFSHGSALGDFSIKLVKVNIFVISPVSNPVTLQMEYAAFFGVMLDTGDLWNLCREIKETVEREPD